MMLLHRIIRKCIATLKVRGESNKVMYAFVHVTHESNYAFKF